MNTSEFTKTGSRLLEEDEQKFYVLKAAIQEGLDSRVAVGFDAVVHLKNLKLKRSKGA